MSHNVITYGTSHFVTHKAARTYYKGQGFDPGDVEAKLKRGEISIGAPSLKPGQRARVNPEGRYVIEERGTTQAVTP